MKIDKSIKAMPWPEPLEGNPRQHFRVTLAWPVVDHERLMVATFTRNTHKECHYTIHDFRLVCSKKLPAAAVLFKGEKIGKRKSLNDALRCCSVHGCYPEISERDERGLAKWLGKDPQCTQNHFMPELGDWVNEAIAAEALRERDARGELRDEDVDLCPEELPEGIERYIRANVLPRDKTLIYRKGNTRGICYSCGHEVRAYLQRFRQNEIVRCPDCGEVVTCYLNTSDRFKVAYVENIASIQKGNDGKTLFIRQWHIRRDTTAQWGDISGYLQEVCRYAIRGNRVAKWQHEMKDNWYMNTYRYPMDKWVRMQNTYEVYDGRYFFYCPDNWQEALSGTSLRYCDLSTYLADANNTRLNRNVIRFLMDWAKYPMMEKFWKAGYTHLVHEHVAGLRKGEQHTVRWNRNSFRDSLRFPTRLLKIHSPEDWTMTDMQKVTKLWDNVQAGTIQEKDIPELARSMASMEHIQDALGHASVHKILQYIARGVEEERVQRRKEKAAAEKRGQSYWEDRDFDTPTTYRDYLKDCIALHLNLDDKEVLFPPNLNAAHTRTIAEVKYQGDKAKKELFAHEVQRLQWMAWEHDGFLIRLPVDAAELIAEGQYLHHCVGGYADRMANGKTTILLIRRAEEPDTPFYTLEWLNGRVQQCRTMRNADYIKDDQVRNFVDAWVQKIAKKGKKKKAATSAA